jgi:eukaryotic-like serine/threonine-protein kinase
MSAPVSKVVCPTCQTAYDAAKTNFCARCGADLRSTSTSLRTTSPAARSAGSSSSGVDPLVNRLIDGRYRVLERIGHGGMGVVYKIEHQRIGKIAAMKVLHRELADDREVVKRFRREAEAVSKLTHPNTVAVFDFGTADGCMYLVMELVRGEDLGAAVRAGGPLPVVRALPLFIQICGALGEAHELGIVHRDLKPENVLVTRTKEGREVAKVLDFGLAKLGEREEAADITGRGAIVGTPYYMSPEQVRGEELDHRSDIYSLGALMYRVLTGCHPFEAQSAVGVLTKHLTEELVPPRARRPELDIDPRVDAVVVRAMAKEREHRHASVDILREDLERIYEELRPHPSAQTPAAPARPSSSRSALARTEPVGVAAIDAAAVAAVTPVRIGAALAPAKARRADETMERRLQRQDFDAFERSLRRRGVVRLTAIPLVACLLVGGVIVYLRWQRTQPHETEVEPNNDLETATRIALGRPVRGKISQRLSDQQGDRDYYRLDTRARPGAPLRLRLDLAAIPTMDLMVDVFDSTGKRLALADNLGAGGGELVPNLAVDEATIYLAVSESRKGSAGRPPTENLSDEYTLLAATSPIAPGEEVEPNDDEASALRLAPEAPITGYLGGFRDIDRFRFDGAEGDYDVMVTVAAMVPARLRVRGAEAVAPPLRRVHLRPGDAIDLLRADEQADDESRPSAVGVDAPYELRVQAAR